jgi:hypothetical protein
VKIVQNLAKSERIVFTPNSIFIKRRGSLMGEPLTKAVLTILNLACEEAAIREYLWWSRHRMSLRETDQLGILENRLLRVYNRESGVNKNPPWNKFRGWIRLGNSDNYDTKFVSAESPSDFIRKCFNHFRESEVQNVVECRYTVNSHHSSTDYYITGDIQRLFNKTLESFSQASELLEPEEAKGSFEFYKGPVQLNWRAFSVGGDDHIAYGPLWYLERITYNHLCWGSIISKTKHGIARKAVKYCEKILYFEGRDLNVSPKQINRTTQDYERSVFVDSVKVRLLSPLSKSIEVRNDRNIAIGKAKSLGRTLRWMNRDIFDDKWVQMVRTRFVRRMKHYLPKEGTSLFYQILLPEELGGLDLYLNGEMLSIFNRVPLPTKQFISRLLEGKANFRLLRKFKTFTANGIQRGFDFKIGYAEDLESFGPGVEEGPIFEIRDKLGLSTELSLRKLVRKLSSLGWMTFDDLLRESLRGYLFEGILAGIAEPKRFTTTPWKRRYATLWDETYDPNYDVLGPEIIIPKLKELENIQRFLPLKVFNTLEEVPYFDREKVKDFESRGIEYRYIDAQSHRPLIEDLREELPNLKMRLW